MRPGGRGLLFFRMQVQEVRGECELVGRFVD
jgi:hypothetical protein